MLHGLWRGCGGAGARVGHGWFWTRRQFCGEETAFRCGAISMEMTDVGRFGYE